MKKIINVIETNFWGIWFTIVVCISLYIGMSFNSQMLVLVLIGWIISVATQFFLKKSEKKFRFNLCIGLIWAVVYFLIGYPNLKIQSGDSQKELVWLLFLLSIVPIIILVTIKIINNGRSRS